MIIYRLARSEYSNDLTGHGAFLYGGRWNSKGQYAVYFAAHISLAVLEIVVNYERSIAPLRPSYHLVEIEIDDNDLIEIDGSLLKKNWNSDLDYSQYIGDQFLQSKSNLALKIPSVVIPEECNFLINPTHPRFKTLKIKNAIAYDLDHRLF
ncbi:MAG TPA: RES family NAD+ phosphorylase [Niabella sp.]|mgnify:CR=1 FL=1|nr:RES family NAD+ phosphorylase [Niabella sp.]HOZ98127.1 RES family NAD+ phosphorylase [Niabella sp.]HQW16129.1 RES family NAD+ phosphorylase [Niabella sp.]HQX21341.1 RES family NAD+ phosphorylase [Niabella sp.]HRB08124.1 RES family NAD+ phosphorylase [Niabella sp.]